VQGRARNEQGHAKSGLRKTVNGEEGKARRNLDVKEADEKEKT